jgi:hypothetical protein
MDIAVTGCDYCAGFIGFKTNRRAGSRIDSAFIRAVSGFTVGTEFNLTDLDRKLAVIRLEVDRNPADMVFRFVWVRNLFANADTNLDVFAGSGFCRGLYHRNVFFGFPVGMLNKFA